MSYACIDADRRPTVHLLTRREMARIPRMRNSSSDSFHYTGKETENERAPYELIPSYSLSSCRQGNPRE